MAAHPVDVYVGAKLKTKRTAQGLSQSEIGRHLGVTFQQVQKYEKGVNRIGPSKLYEVAQLLKAPISYFFEGYEKKSTSSTNSDVLFLNEDGDEFDSENNVSDREALRLIKAFSSIKDVKVRKQITSLVKAMASKNGTDSE